MRKQTFHPHDLTCTINFLEQNNQVWVASSLRAKCYMYSRTRGFGPIHRNKNVVFGSNPASS